MDSLQQNTPKHIGIIMDGNGRWAAQRNRPRSFGHAKGALVAREVIETCVQEGIKSLTLYAFSTENWLRPQQEVRFLMKLLRKHIIKETPLLHENKIRFTAIGDLNRLDQDLRQVLQDLMRATSSYDGMQLVFALSYGARWEIAQATKHLVEGVLEGTIKKEDLEDEETLGRHLSTYPNPDPDLIIRTGGEMRLSNFLLWQAAYSELFFTPTLWPDFTHEEFLKALGQFGQRQRRFGSVPNSQSTNP